jgi:hypothetical protein
MDHCKHCGNEVGYWRLWRAYWSYGPLANFAPKTVICPSCGRQNSVGIGTGIVGVILVVLAGVALAMMWTRIDLPLDPETEEFVEILFLSYCPSVIIVSFLYPLFARLGSERPPQLYRWQYWSRFVGVTLLLASVVLLALGWCFSLIAIGLCCGLVMASVFCGPARRVLLRVFGASASDTPWPPPRDATQDVMVTFQYVRFIMASAAAAFVTVYFGVSMLLRVGFSAQNLFLMFLGD